MSFEQLQWGNPGVCPSCGVVSEHTWFHMISGKYQNPADGRWVDKYIDSSHGELLISRCASQACRSIALWFRDLKTNVTEFVYPQQGIRHPPQEGMEPEEIKLYEEAAAVEPISPRASCALVRALLEALIKRHLVAAGHSVEHEGGKKKNLYGLIESAVEQLDLSPQLKRGLNAIRQRGNSAVHDPYGLTDDTRIEELPWLFQAVDDLVDDLHTKPQRWGEMAQP